MTPSQLDHLRKIDAHLVKLLENSKKRTPGRWDNSRYHYPNRFVVVRTGDSDNDAYPTSRSVCEVWHGESKDAAFIASCAGNAEAGWNATRAAISLCIANLHTDPEFPAHEAGEICDNDGLGCRACGYTERILLESILTAFPLELIQKP